MEKPPKALRQALAVRGTSDMFRHIDNRSLPASATGGSRLRPTRFFHCRRLLSGKRSLVIKPVRDFRIVFPVAMHAVVWGFQPWHWQQADMGAMALSDLLNTVTLFVEQVSSDIDGKLRNHHSRVLLHRLFLDQAKDGKRQGLDGPDCAVPFTTGAGHLGEFPKCGSKPLPGQFQKPEAGDPSDLHTSPVQPGALPEFVFDLFLVRGAGHVDEIDHDKAAEVTQP